MRAWYPYLKKERYWNYISQIGILSWFTKKPANNMNGMIRIGVRVTANCLSANRVEMMSA
jgi:hypothetical protein